jgi:anti-anti-sigma factor
LPELGRCRTPADWHSHSDGTTITIRLSGELDIANVDALRASTGRLVDADRLIVDLRAVTFLDSTVLGALVRLHRGAEARGATMQVIASADSMPRHLLEVTGLDELFLVTDTEDDPAASRPDG